MKITLAKTAGFCFGVNRAVQMVYDLWDEGDRVCTLGPIIHNPQLVEELSDRGVRIVDDAFSAEKDETLVIRSHGGGESVYLDAEKRGVKICDATCPFVAKIHKIVNENSLSGDTVFIVGDKTHQEVIGIMGHCKNDVYVFSTVEELEEMLKNDPDLSKKALTVVSQTTFNAKKWIFIQNFLFATWANT